MGSTTASVTASSGYYAYATITWDSSSTVEVDVESNGSWRIRGQASAGDKTVYLSNTGSVSGTFSATNGTTYVLQVYDPVEDTYYNNTSTSLFTVNFNSDSGEDDSGNSGNTGEDDSGEDDSGGDSSSSNSSVYPASGTQNGVTATITISGSTVTVKVSSTNLPWRVNGTNSGGDHGTYYISENRNSSGSFTAENGHAYAFQVCSNGYWSDGLIFYTNIDSGGGSSGDDSGGSSGGINSSLKEYEFTALGVRAKATYTSGPEVAITILSWSGYGSIPYWRIKGVKSEGDGNTYLEQNNKSSNSFDSVDLGYGDGFDNGGKNYIFQVCKDGNWNNDGGDASKFHVDFSLAGEGGGEVTDSYAIYFNEGEGASLTVTRISSTYGSIGTMYKNGNIYYDDIWANDRFEIVVEAQEGYQLNELIVDGLDYANGVYTFNGNGDASITTSATLIASIRIFNKNTSSWDTYTPYIYDGSNWNRYRPYIYDSSSWNMYS